MQREVALYSAPPLTAEISPHKAPAAKKRRRRLRFNMFLLLPELQLLETFSFLQTAEVINAAQVCRAVFTRVDTLFGIESGIIVRPAWEQESIEMKAAEASGTVYVSDDDEDSPPVKAEADPPVPTPSLPPAPLSPSPAAPPPPPQQQQQQRIKAMSGAGSTPVLNSPGAVDLTSPGSAAGWGGTAATGGVRMGSKEVESMIKKLSPAELKYVLHINEQLKQKQKQLDELDQERIRLQERCLQSPLPLAVTRSGHYVRSQCQERRGREGALLRQAQGRRVGIEAHDAGGGRGAATDHR